VHGAIGLAGRRPRIPERGQMARRLHCGGGMDALYIGIVIAFFAASWAFVVACDRLA